MAGSSAWIWRSASRPLRAVPTTRNSGEPSMICVMRRRMNALSSTTSTVAGDLDDTVALLERAYLEPAVGQVEVHAASVVESRVLGDDRHPRRGERLARCGDVALAHVDAGVVDELPEHARPADDLGGDACVACAQLAHLLQHEGDDRLRKLRRVADLARHGLARQEDVRERADLRVAIIERDRDARAQPDRGEDVRAAANGVV